MISKRHDDSDNLDAPRGCLNGCAIIVALALTGWALTLAAEIAHYCLTKGC